jgi:hypothetical protein
MMFFCALMATITSLLMLLLLCDEMRQRRIKLLPSEPLMDAFLLIGFLCSLVVSATALIATFH